MDEEASATLALGKRLNRVDHSSATDEEMMDVLNYASSATLSPEVRLIAKHKVSLILWETREPEQKRARLRMLMDKLGTTDDPWLQRNILESLYPHVRRDNHNEILAILDQHVTHPLVRQRGLSLYGRKNGG